MNKTWFKHRAFERNPLSGVFLIYEYIKIIVNFFSVAIDFVNVSWTTLSTVILQNNPTTICLKDALFLEVWIRHFANSNLISTGVLEKKKNSLFFFCGI